VEEAGRRRFTDDGTNAIEQTGLARLLGNCQGGIATLANQGQVNLLPEGRPKSHGIVSSTTRWSKGSNNIGFG
jgi:hypothetical protein